MVCPITILTSSLALSLLRHSAPPHQSFVLSPFSLNTALSIIHDGANGTTQKELTLILLNGCTSSDVSDFYSSLAMSHPSNNGNGVTFKIANRFYVHEAISLKRDYTKHIDDKYGVNVKNINLGNKVQAAKEMNKFVDGATNGKIKEVVKPDQMSDVAILINAIYSKVEKYFRSPQHLETSFQGIEFMSNHKEYFRVNLNNDIGTLLLMPYQDETCQFFYLMPEESSNLEKWRNELTGEKLVDIVKNAKYQRVDITVPKFKVGSQLDGIEVLKKMGITRIFNSTADLSKISPTRLFVSKIQHNAEIEGCQSNTSLLFLLTQVHDIVLWYCTKGTETTELGTEAAAMTRIDMAAGGSASFTTPPPVPHIVIYRPFLFGIIRHDDIIFIGQYVE